MAEFPANLQLASLDGTNGFKLSGATAEDFAGRSVSSAGDVNGDGFEDVIVGAHGADPNGTGSGASYIVFGRATGFAPNPNLGALTGADGFRLVGSLENEASGHSVRGAGDVNGDGFDDVIVGAYGASFNGEGSGASYVVFGRAAGFAADVNLAGLSGADGFRLSGMAPGDFAGHAVASAGDVNGDGFDDLIIGAYGADPSGETSGASYVVFGKATGFASNVSLGSLTAADGFTISGAAAGDFAGFSVGAAGDVNGDGFDDVIVGAYGADPNGDDSGASYVVFGKATGFAANVDLGALSGADGFRLSGESASHFSGQSVSSAGDVNADGFDDLIVGAYGADPNGAESGASYVVFGRASGFGANVELGTLDGANGFKLSGGATSDYSGYSVSSAGDVNGDGFSDLIVGAFLASEQSGASYVVFGKAGGFAPDINLGALTGTDGFRLSGEAFLDFSGSSVSAAGDVNGDGFDDVIVEAYAADANGAESGASYVVFGRAPDTAVTRTGTNVGNTINGGEFDDTLNGLGGNDVLEGRGGADVLNGGDGARDVASYEHAGAGVRADLLAPGGNTNDAAGDSYTGIESLRGSRFADELYGTNGSNVIDGREGADTMVGRGGNDVYDVDDVIDVVIEVAGEGTDTVRTTVGFGQLADNVERVTVAGRNGLAVGGNDLANLMTGGVGDDTLAGGVGRDKVRGGEGDDRLVGGQDGDALTGGDGADVFAWTDLFEFRIGAKRDVILDFEQGADLIDLSAIATARPDGAFVLLDGSAGRPDFTGAGGELRLITTRNGTYVVQGDTNGDRVVDLEIAVESRTGSALTLTAADFLL